jgi:hypothetical protein
VARFLTEEWVAEFNAALDGAVLPLPGPDGGLAAADGNFVVAEEIRDTPDGDIRVMLRVDGGRIRLSRRAPSDRTGPAEDAATGPAEDAEENEELGEAANVTIVLSYPDAVALSSGELTPAEALAAGRIRVRGDLSVLVSAYSMLEAARERTAGLAADTTY